MPGCHLETYDFSSAVSVWLKGKGHVQAQIYVSGNGPPALTDVFIYVQELSSGRRWLTGKLYCKINGYCRQQFPILADDVTAQICLLYFSGPQISCFTPTNFTAKQASYVDTYCWDSLMHHEFDSDGNFEERSLWVHKVSVKFLIPLLVMPTQSDWDCCRHMLKLFFSPV